MKKQKQQKEQHPILKLALQKQFKALESSDPACADANGTRLEFGN